MHRIQLALALSALLTGASLALGDHHEASEADAGNAENGQQVYSLYCTTCHGPEGDGKGPVGASLDPAPRDFTKGDFKFGGTDQDIFDVISNGAMAQGGSALMAPWGAVIPEADRWALVKFIRSLKK